MIKPLKSATWKAVLKLRGSHNPLDYATETFNFNSLDTTLVAKSLEGKYPKRLWVLTKLDLSKTHY